MRPPMVEEADPVTDHAHRMLLGFEAVEVRALLLQYADDALDYARSRSTTSN